MMMQTSVTPEREPGQHFRAMFVIGKSAITFFLERGWPTQEEIEGNPSLAALLDAAGSALLALVAVLDEIEPLGPNRNVVLSIEMEGGARVQLSEEDIRTSMSRCDDRLGLTQLSLLAKQILELQSST